MKHHKYFISEEGESDDLEHITAIKRTITGLIDFSRDLFLDSCIEVAMEDYDEEEDDDNGDEQKTREDHIEWFNRIYEYEEYPY